MKFQDHEEMEKEKEKEKEVNKKQIHSQKVQNL
jgi:hypothetical protein